MAVPAMARIVTLNVNGILGGVFTPTEAAVVAPVFVPLAQQLGVDLLHYGIIMTAVMGIALFLPSFGVGMFIVQGIAGCPLRDLARELFPYLVTMLAVALIIAYVPAISFVVPATLGLYRVPGT